MQGPDRSDELDPFELLGVARGCSSDDLVKAYRALARRYHPDVNQDPDAPSRMRAINAALARAREELAASQSAGGTHARSAVRIVHWHDRAPVRQETRWDRLRGWVIGGALLLVAGTLIWALTIRFGAPGSPAGAAHPALTPGQQATLTWPDLGHVALAERKLATLTAGLYPRDRAQWSSDGRYVALWVDDLPTAHDHPQILVFNTADFALIMRIAGFGARWAPNSDQLALLVAPAPNAVPELVIADIARGAQTVWARSAGSHLAWSPNGELIAFSAQAQRAVETLDLSTRKTQPLFLAPRGTAIMPIGWVDNATILCLAQAPGDTQLVSLPLASPQLTTITDLGTSPVIPIADSRTDQLLYASQATEQSSGKLYMSDAGGQSTTLIDARGGFSTVAGWSGDGRWLAYTIQDAHSQNTGVCLLPLQARTFSNWPGGATRCLAVSGPASNLTWERVPAGDRLCFFVTQPTGTDLDEVSVGPVNGQSPQARMPRAAVVRAGPGRSTSVPGSRGATLLLLGIAGWWRRARRVARSRAGPARTRPDREERSNTMPPVLRVGIVSEALKWPPDEALKRIALAMVRAMASQGNVLAVGTRGQRRDAEPYPVEGLRTNRAFFSPRLWRLCAAFRPNVVCYIPGSGLTTWSLVRAVTLLAGLRLCGQQPLLTLVVVQPRQRGIIGRWLLARVNPAMVVVQSEAAREQLLAQGCDKVHVLNAGVDLSVFTPVSAARRMVLRQAYGIAPDKFVVLHVGHLKANRQLDDLIPLARQLDRGVVLVVGSTSTVADHRVSAQLSRAGIQVMHRYLAHIEEIYQLADCYIFPVRDDQASAQLPLSVLEALACELPVITTRFGALPEYFPGGEAVEYCDSRDELIAAVRARQNRARPPAHGRALVRPHDWDEQFSTLAWELRLMLSRRHAPEPSPTSHWSCGTVDGKRVPLE